MSDDVSAYALRFTRSANKMGWLTIIDGEIEWHSNSPLAHKIAQKALDDAKAEGYVVHVYVCKCVSQNG